ncbi:DUF616 domain-containing protein [Tetraselmis virus 1]|uniref:DUF616 domain-containing protein n=1 Tax=Tetraselmis virus 1 TaxID=2060617 RepID=A0A2P0VMU2_9VIRU|nr:DUF616 domain-containing protein [Tetraselmis virus 1]AUF82224.1 DUF616 domain-containing protein [Tetraselmis virus 1]
MCTKVLYTALIGDYDPLMGIQDGNSDWKFVMYTDLDIDFAHLTPEQKRWEFRKADVTVGDTPRHVNRWYKLHPHLLFPDFEHSIYIDSRFGVKDLSYIDEKINKYSEKDHVLAIAPHYGCSCIYREAITALRNGYDTKENIQKIIEVLKDHKYPENNGMFLNNIIYRRHNDPKMVALMEDWWEYIKNYTFRDQLSLNLLLWKNNIVCKPLFGGTEHETILYRKKCFSWESHKNFNIYDPERHMKQCMKGSKRRVLYSIKLGSTSNIKPINISYGWDAIMFTDQNPKKCPRNLGWRFVKIDRDTHKLTHVWYKLHPHILFPDYEWSLYIDPNAGVKDLDFFDVAICKLAQTGDTFAVPSHPSRNCAYKHIESLIIRKKDSETKLQALKQEMLRHSYPSNKGLSWVFLMLRKHNDPIISGMMKNWWNTVKTITPRDDASLDYNSWKQEYVIKRILNDPNTFKRVIRK